MIVIVDTREKNPWNFDDMEIGTLKEGDYTSKELLDYENKTGEKTIRIERKASTAELAGNLGRTFYAFEDEMKRLYDYKEKYLILEFSKSTLMAFPKGSGIPRKAWGKVKMNPKFLLSRLEYLSNVYDVQVIFAGDRDNAMEIAKEILENAIKETIKR